MSQYIIRKPYLQHKARRILSFMVVLVLWFSFLWQFYQAIISLTKETRILYILEYLLHSFGILFLVMLVPVIGLSLWATYNYICFQHQYRHSKKQKVTDIETYQLLVPQAAPVGVIKKSKVLLALDVDDKMFLQKATQKDIENITAVPLTFE